MSEGRKGERQASSLRALAALLPWLWRPGKRLRLFAVLVFLLLGKLMAVAVPLAYQRIIDAFAPGEVGQVMIMGTFPLMLILVYSFTKLAAQLFAELRDAVFAQIGQHAVRILSGAVFGHIQNLSLRYHLDRRTGGLSRILERGVEAVQTLLQFVLFSVGPTLIELTLALIALTALFGAQYAILVAATILTYVAVTVILTRWRIILRRILNDASEASSARAVDSLLNWETVQYFSNSAHETERYDESMARYERAAVRSQVSLSVLNVAQHFTIVLGECLLILLAARAILDGELTLGGLVAVVSYLMQLHRPLSILGFAYRQIRTALTDIEKLFSILDLRSEVTDRPNAKQINVTGGEIRFADVIFSYEAKREILKDINFHIPAGRSVAVVGETGAGKSTLARLLFRFYDVTGGKILVDGQDIRDVTQESLRQAIGIVPQDPVLFNDTIAYNIGYGRLEANIEEIRHAARAARLDSFIMSLPDGYDTRVGERGLKLSGGERQRIAIARTILKDPAIFVFDEASSALDSQAEQEIQANIRQLFSGRSMLMIAHRLSTIVDVDEILVLRNGRIEERGAHQGLLQEDGLYAALWRAQSREKQIG